MRRGLVGRRAASFAALILLAICCVLHIGILFWKQVRQDDIRHQEEIASPGAAFAPRMVPDAATFSAKDFVHVVVIFDAERTRHAMAMLTTVLLHAPSLTPVMLHIVTASSEYGLLESWMFWAKTKLSRTQDSLQLYDYGQCWELAGLVMHMSAPHVSLASHCNLGVHWCDLLRSSGISDVDAAGVSRENGQWHYLGLSTKVASGSHHLQFCDKATLFCAGSHGNSCGTDIRQVMAVKTAIDNGGVHPRAP